MNPSKMTFRQALERLRSEGRISAEQLALAPAALLSKETHTPIFIGVLIGIGAWLTGLFFTGFVLVLTESMHADKSGVLMMGASYLVGATLLRRVAKHLFFIQAALALTVVGYLMVMVVIFDRSWAEGRLFQMAMTSVIMSAVVFVINPCSIVGFVMPLACVGFVLEWMTQEHLYAPLAILVLAQTVALTWIVQRRRDDAAFRVVALSLVFSLAITLCVLFVQAEHASSWRYWYYYDHAAAIHLWQATSHILTALLGVWLLYLVRWFARRVLPESERDQWYQRSSARAALLASVMLAATANAGVVAFTGIMLLAYGLHERRMLAAAVALLCGFLIYLFVDLHDIVKDTVRAPAALLASGVVFLCVRLWLLHGTAQSDTGTGTVTQTDEFKWQRHLLWGGAAFIFLVLNGLALIKG